jgi:molecular chaperone GrpE
VLSFHSRLFTTGSESKNVGDGKNGHDVNDVKNANETKTTAQPQEADDANPHSISPHEAKIKELQKQLDESKQELLISFADRENTRRIAKKDVDSARSFGIQNFATSILDVADNLDRALESVAKEALENTSLKSFYEGVELTRKELNKTFTKYEIVKSHPLGEKFNPNLHQAVVEVHDPSKEQGTIAFVMKSGYTLKDRLLRPATVGVVKVTPPPSNESKKAEESAS